MLPRVWFFALLLVALSVGRPVEAREIKSYERRIQRAVDDARDSVVVVFSRTKGFDLTGVVVGNRYTILTLRAPLLKNGSLDGEFEVRFPKSKKTVRASVIAEDKETGTVLLRAKATGKPIAVRHASDLDYGTPVVLAGNAFGAGKESDPTMGLGFVSGFDRVRKDLRYFHISALVNPGSFGAPIIDLDGRLLGIALLGVTAAGGQTVVIPYERIRANYVAQGGDAQKAIGAKIYPRRQRPKLAESIGRVAQAAVARARGALVGVRALELVDPPSPAPKTPPSGPGVVPGLIQKPKKPKGPPMPRLVPGKRKAHDRSSGLVIDADGWILCPLRVTGWPGPPRVMRVDMPDGSDRPATVAGYDERLRVALLRVETSDLHALPPAPNESYQAGRIAIALGFSHASPDVVTPQVNLGIVSRTDALKSLHPVFAAVQTDAKISGGNRGGPLVDLEGRLLGMILDVNDTEGVGYARRVRGRYVGNAGLGFALPMHIVEPLLARMKAGAKLKAAFLGVRTIAVTGGMQIVTVTPDSAAAKAKLQPGDIIAKVDGKPVRTGAEFAKSISKKTAGEKLKLKLIRKEKTRELELELGEFPS